MNELRHALRTLLARPALALVAVLTLALGIGANTAIFSVINAVLLRPLPFPEPDRLVQLGERSARGTKSRVSHPNFVDWRQRSTSFDEMAQFGCDTVSVLGTDEPRFAHACAVSGGFFTVLGVSPERGRTFAPEELRLNGPAALLVSHRFWSTALAGAADLSTLTLRLEGRPFHVIGVMPDGVDFPEGTDVWTPSDIEADGSGRTAHNWTVIGRVKRGVAVSSASAEMDAIGAQLKAQYGNDENAVGVVTTPLQDALVPPKARQALFLLLGTVALVLLIACANVAATLLARGEERRTEMAIRAALGAGRGRLVRQLLVESAMLGLLGGGAGLLLAAWLIRMLRSLSDAVPRADTIGIDGSVLAFTMVLALATPLLFGLLPSLQASRADLRAALAEGGRAAAPARAGVRAALVTAEVAIALLLLVGSALLVRSFAHVMSVDPGFDPANVVTADMAVPVGKYTQPVQAAQFYATLLERVRALPGVAAAGATTQLPLGSFDADGAFAFEGHPDEGAVADHVYDGFKYSAGYKVVTPGYFEALGMHLRAGRTLQGGDAAGHPAVAVVSESFVRQFLPHTNPIGVRFHYAGMERVNPVMTIVGVVGDVLFQGLTSAPEPQVFVPMAQAPYRAQYTVSMAVRAVDPSHRGTAAAGLREALREFDGDVPVEISSLEAMVNKSVADRRLLLTLVAAFAMLALVLAATGIYGVLSQSVAQRTAEIGVRMALGADARTVITLMLRSAMTHVAIGAAIGLAAAAASMRLLASFLFEVRPLDPGAFALALALLAAVALSAAYVPARRATRVDPLLALRSQ